MNDVTINRRTFVKACLAAGVAATTIGIATGCSNSESTGTQAAPSSFLYTGSWNEKGGNPGLYLHTYDEQTGEIGEAVKQADISVGFILADTEKKLLYVTEEADNAYDRGKELNAGKGGSIYVYQVDEQTGSLTELQASPAYGSNPSMVSFSPDGKYLLCSIHTAKPSPCHAEKIDGTWKIRPAMPSPNCVSFPIKEDGTLDSPADILTFAWTPGEHVSQLHTVTWAPDGSFFIIADKGTTYLYSMALDADGKINMLSTNKELGASARYVRFSPDGSIVYVNSESANEVAAFEVKEDKSLQRIGEGEVVPAEIKDAMPKGAKFEQQDMKLNSEGTFLYDVVRGSDDNTSTEFDTYGQKVHGASEGQFQGISVLAIEENTHLPVRVQYVDLADVEGWWPRGISLTPEEDRVVVASLYGDILVEMDIRDDGTLDEDNKRTFTQDTAANLTFYAKAE